MCRLPKSTSLHAQCCRCPRSHVCIVGWPGHYSCPLSDSWYFIDAEIEALWSYCNALALRAINFRLNRSRSPLSPQTDSDAGCVLGLKKISDEQSQLMGSRLKPINNLKSIVISAINSRHPLYLLMWVCSASVWTLTFDGQQRANWVDKVQSLPCCPKESRVYPAA